MLFAFIIISTIVIAGSIVDLYHEITWYNSEDIRAMALNVFGITIGCLGLMTGIILI